jgi:hypothetical protein
MSKMPESFNQMCNRRWGNCMANGIVPIALDMFDYTTGDNVPVCNMNKVEKLLGDLRSKLLAVQREADEMEAGAMAREFWKEARD